MNPRPEKILALQFKYFGDAVLMTPALRALRGYFPQSEIHVLVPAEIAPLFQHTPWLNRVWGMPRRRGRASIQETWPVLRALRRERFDRSVDFAGNDRGALLSRIIGARRRLGRAETGGFFGRQFCYTEQLTLKNLNWHESQLLAHLLSVWNVPPPARFESEIHADPMLEKTIVTPFSQPTLLCHVATSNEKKQWPIVHWVAFYQLAQAAGLKLMFSTGRGAREQQFLAEIKKNIPQAPVLPPDPNLATFIIWLKHVEIFISGDTGPLHYAAALGVRTIGLFGPSLASQWAPLGARHTALQGTPCTCGGLTEHCLSTKHCLTTISPAAVLKEVQKILACSAK